MSVKGKARSLARAYRAYRWRGLQYLAATRAHAVREERAYQTWIDTHDKLSDADRAAIRREVDGFSLRPKISVVMPVYNVEERWLRRCIESVLGQIYENWEFCIADDASPAPHVRRVLEEYAARDPRIKVVFREANGHISAASNSALALATGEFCALLDHDDEIPEHALYFVAREINRFPHADMIYSDEDVIDASGRRYDPKFKPDWSPDLLYSLNLTTHLSVYRTAILRRINGFRLGLEGSQDYDLALRVLEQTSARNIRHIPRILYHWRAIPGSVAMTSDEKPYAHDRARQAIGDHFRRTGVAADVEPGLGFLHRARYRLPTREVPASIIVRADELTKRTVAGVLSGTDYKPFEIVVVGRPRAIEKARARLGGAPVRFVESRADGIAAALNDAAREASGEVLVFLRSGLAPTQSGWLAEFVSHALRPEVGAVGGKTLFADGRIKQAGLVLGVAGAVGQGHRGLPPNFLGSLLRAQFIGNFAALSADCLAIRREVFGESDGFNTRDFPARFFAVDLCLRLWTRDLRVVWTPYAEFNQARRQERRRDPGTPQDAWAELDLLKSRWATWFENDPYYNPNLSLDDARFSLALPPRAPLPFRDGS